MMVGSLLGATIATYWVSRLLMRATRGFGGWQGLLAAHLASLALLMAATALLKSYFVLLPFSEMVVYVAPQLFWLVVDALRGKQLRIV